MPEPVFSPVVTRFAPSPTGFLHIGSARTALFNWLFSHHHKGSCRLRIEDTDTERSTQEATDKILESLHWLGLSFDGDIVYQSKQRARHQSAAYDLHQRGHAYFCSCTPTKIERMREEARAQGLPQKYNGHCRNKNLPHDHRNEQGDLPVLRFKTPLTGVTTIQDEVQGPVTIDNTQLDDIILLRKDGTPTYMLSVVVDDHDMSITHIIRGDDHLTNAFRQYHIYQAAGWSVPIFAHIPLIHGEDGSKLSKRHGALGAEHYRDEGFLHEAMNNYLLRLGFAHKDEEIIPQSRAIEIFNLQGIGKSPSRFDIKKLTHLNGHYIRECANTDLMHRLQPFLSPYYDEADDISLADHRILRGMDGLKQRAKTLKELAFMAALYIRPHPLDDTAASMLQHEKIQCHLASLLDMLSQCPEPFKEHALENITRSYATHNAVKLGDVAQALRIALTGRTVSPSVFEIMAILGKDESLKRLIRIQT